MDGDLTIGSLILFMKYYEVFSGASKKLIVVTWTSVICCLPCEERLI